jgi:hypothetical protein
MEKALRARRHEDWQAFRKLLREFHTLEKRLQFMERDRDELERAINRPYEGHSKCQLNKPK